MYILRKLIDDVIVELIKIYGVYGLCISLVILVFLPYQKTFHSLFAHAQFVWLLLCSFLIRHIFRCDREWMFSIADVLLQGRWTLTVVPSCTAI